MMVVVVILLVVIFGVDGGGADGGDGCMKARLHKEEEGYRRTILAISEHLPRAPVIREPFHPASESDHLSTKFVHRSSRWFSGRWVEEVEKAHGLQKAEWWWRWRWRRRGQCK